MKHHIFSLAFSVTMYRVIHKKRSICTEILACMGSFYWLTRYVSKKLFTSVFILHKCELGFKKNMTLSLNVQWLYFKLEQN